MKKLILITFILGMFMVSCKDDPAVPPISFKTSQEQKSAGFYFSGNWCGPCGLYGKPALTSVSSKHKDNFVWISSQLNGGAADPFNCADAEALANAFNVNAVPTIFVGANGNQFESVSGGTEMEATLNGFVTANKAKTPTANIALSYKFEDGAISVTTETEYFEDTDKEYSISVYIIENLRGDQYVTGSGWIKDTEFHNVLRTKLSANVMGDALPSGSKTKGKIETMTYGDFLQSNWVVSNLRVVAVLWVKNSAGQLAAVNATVK